MCNAS